MPYRLAFEFIDMPLHFDGGRGAQGSQQIGDLGKPEVRFLQRNGIVLDGAGIDVGAVDAAGRPFRVLLLDKSVRQREDLLRFQMRACGGELQIVLEAGERARDCPCGSQSTGEGKELAFHCAGAFGS